MTQLHLAIYKSMSILNDSTDISEPMIVNNSILEPNESVNDNMINTPVNSNMSDNSFTMLETNSVDPSLNWSNDNGEELVSRKRQNNENPSAESKKIKTFCNIGKDKVKDNNDEDENFQFLMSLLPYLRDIPKHRKMAVRNKIQKVFLDEQEKCYAYNTWNPNCSSAGVVSSNATQHQVQNLQHRPPPPPYENYRHNLVTLSSATPAAAALNLLNANSVQQQNIDYSAFHSSYQQYTPNNNTNTTTTAAQATAGTSAEQSWTYTAGSSWSG